MELWVEIVALIFSALIGAGIVLFLSVPGKNWMKLLISFSGAYLLGLCMVHLLPFSMDAAGGVAGYFVLGGFLLQLILEYFSEGVEHGHSHVHHHNESTFPIVVMISLFIHAFIEGMPFGEIHHGHDHHHDSLLIGIVLHKLPVAMVLTAMLVNSGLKKLSVYFWVFLFAIMAPLGTMAYHYFLESFPNVNAELYTGAVNALLVGVLLHVSTTILFESTDGHKFNLWKFVSVILGFLLSAIII